MKTTNKTNEVGIKIDNTLLKYSHSMTYETRVKIWDYLKSEFYKDYNPQNDTIKIKPVKTVRYITLWDINPSLTPKNGKIVKQGKDYNTKATVFDLLSGWSCPAAQACLRKVHNGGGTLLNRRVENLWTQYPCFAVKAESQYVMVYLRRLVNMKFIEYASQDEIEAVLSEIVSEYSIIRFHGAGDFFLKKYFIAACKVALNNPSKVFYGYTKMLPYVTAAKPDNFGLIYSDGGKFDEKAESIKAPRAYVESVSNPELNPNVNFACENKENDFEYILRGESFLLHLH